MDGSRDSHTEWNKLENDEYHVISLTCGILKNGTNDFSYKTEADSQTHKTSLRLPKGKRGDTLGVWD